MQNLDPFFSELSKGILDNSDAQAYKVTGEGW